MIWWGSVFLLVLLHHQVLGEEPKNAAGNKTRIGELLRSVPVRFIENKGQIADLNHRATPFVLFKAGAPGADLYITESGLTYVFLEKEPKSANKPGDGVNRYKNRNLNWQRVDMTLAGVSIRRENVIREQPSGHHFNFYYGHCPEGIFGVREYGKITIREIYPGIDWVLYNPGDTGFKYDFIVHPGARMSDIKMIYTSLSPLSLENDGSLRIHDGKMTLTEKTPYSYFREGGGVAETGFSIISRQKKGELYQCEIGFDVASRSPDKTMVIDPQLVWSTFMGGNGLNGCMNAETDTSGNLFVVGYGTGAGFPLQNAGTYFQGSIPLGNATSNFILKFSNAGTLLWGTYYGDNNHQYEPRGFSIDPQGNIFLAGSTLDPSFPLQNAGSYFQSTFSNKPGASDMYILKFDNNGNRLWATYYGGSDEDYPTSLDTDTAGNVFISGKTFSTDFPVFNGGGYFQGTYNSTTNLPVAFLLKFDNAGNRLWATYFGSDGVMVNDINCDKSGNLFTAGYVFPGATFPTMNPGGGAWFQGSTATGGDMIITKFNNLGAILWSTFYGGSGKPGSLITDPAGNLYISGQSGDPNLPLLNAGGYFQASPAGFSDMFLLKFSNTGSRLWATFFGGNDVEKTETCDNLEIDTCGSIYMSFETKSTIMPTKGPCDGGFYSASRDNFIPTYTDLFIARFSKTGALLWGTYFGGDGDDFRACLAVDKYNQLFMTGEWTHVNFNGSYPLVNPGNNAQFDSTFNGGGDDMYIAKFNTQQPSPAMSTFFYPQVCVHANTPMSPFTSANFLSGGTYSSAPGLSINVTSGQITGAASVPGTYTVTYTPPECGCLTLPSLTAVAVVDSNIIATIETPSVCAGEAMTVTATIAHSTGATYTWLPGNVNSQSFSVIAQAGSVYTVNGADGSGCSFSGTITPFLHPLPTISFPGAGTLCAGAIKTFTASGAKTYTWNMAAISPTISHGSASGPASYTVHGKDNNGCIGTATLNIQIVSPQISISGQTVICSGIPVQLSAKGAATYTWDSGSQTSTIVVVSNTATRVSVSGRDLNGCQDTTSIAINVSPSPTLTLSNATTCAGQPVALTATTDPAAEVSITWEPGNHTGQLILVQPSASSFYTAVAAFHGCTDTAFAAVNVTEAITPNTQFVYGGPYCPADKSPYPELHPAFTAGGSFFSTPGLVVDKANGSIDLDASAPGNYAVTYTLSKIGCISAGTGTASVGILLSPQLNLQPHIVIAPGTSTVLLAGTASGFTWSPVTGLSCVYCPDPTASPVQSTEYCVTAEEDLCVDKACVLVEVTCDGGRDFSVPNAFTPNGDGENDRFCLRGWDLCIQDFSIMIYDRWGEMVFASPDPDFCWDGMYKGRMPATDVYVYLIKAHYTDGKELVRTGNITLIH